MKWGAPLVTGVITLVASFVGMMVAWFWGVAVIRYFMGRLLAVGYSIDSMSRCGQVWWSLLLQSLIVCRHGIAARGSLEVGRVISVSKVSLDIGPD